MKTSPQRAWLDRGFLASSLLVFGVGLVFCLQPVLWPTRLQAARNDVAWALRDHRADVLQIATAHLRQANDLLSVGMAADAAAFSSDHDLAITLYRRLPRDGGRWEFHRQLGLARQHELQGRLVEAEAELRRALELFPQHMDANERLGNLLQAEGRSWESTPCFLTQILRGKCRGDELLGVSSSERFFRYDEGLEARNQSLGRPEALLKLGAARRLLFENKSPESELRLRELLAVHPELGEAQGRLGRIIVDRGDLREFMLWRGSLNDVAREHPEVWFTQGLQAQRLGQLEGAVACFLQTLKKSPDHLAANVQISGCLQQLGRSDLAEAFSRRGQLLGQLESTLNLVRGSTNVPLMQKAVDLLGQLGRHWEAAGWSYALSQYQPLVARHRVEMRRCLGLAFREPGQHAQAALPVNRLEPSDFKAPQWPIGEAIGTKAPVATEGGVEWEFTEDAHKLGVDFTYFEGTSEATRLQHIFNTMGGGLGVLDYDLDGAPDLYFAQANAWREPGGQPQHLDRLFHNRGERFADVTSSAGLQELGFSHGVTAADFDQDGFPDLHVSNKGPNTLYHNNGDGTFADVTAAAGVGGNEWSTSSVLADFNGDGIPDLYVLNYTNLDATAKMECRRPDGGTMACTPDLLVPEDDRCYISEGNGHFQDVTANCGVLAPNGRGLGVVAWDFEGNGRLGLFVSNDTTANFLFMNRETAKDGTPLFREEGILRGVALDTDGNGQASMGVAAGDTNGDGQIELFVTNFDNESNTMYSQGAGGFFQDLTRPWNLRDASFSMLGFGCQFADFDGDGWNDILVANGHVNQNLHYEGADRMPAQLYQNQAGKRFAEVPRNRLGAFFQRGHLGRGLATLDWNRDGKPDAAISHLHEPVAVLTNRSRRTDLTFKPLVVRLIGTTGCREPTGAAVRVIIPGGASQIQLQTAGDGFLTTNERRLQFAVPVSPSSPAGPVRVEVRWPGDKETQRWENVAAGEEVLLIEGRQEPVLLHRF